ncbi:hypothetical protein FAES_2507 [Fibrella aestuarina BUZ 2]|uniref:Uncharacterized protein n=1 Tax=Fibrella aestuarina BUZ 2 TaxID=1166018 RepID=I0K8R3_9BACT|nr:hypothetical protein [Fibrella aestuarina]CCH00516.1 hypothetical protein FAES_2507 [Fibrella aestuarina BUZ 2]
MDKYTLTALFYVIATIITVVGMKFGPSAQDGGPGLGDLILLAFTCIVLILAVLNVVWGFSRDNTYFILAAVHFLVLAAVLYTFFL